MLKRAYIPASKRVDWNTCESDISLVREAMGSIDTDPCSNANSVVDARLSYTESDNGLVWPWLGSFFCNPPFGSLVPLFFHRGISEIQRGRAAQGIYLVPARIDTKWFHAYGMQATEICVPKGRRRFRGAVSSAPFPVLFLYYGPYRGQFRHVFRNEGAFWSPTRAQRLRAVQYSRIFRHMTDTIDQQLAEHVDMLNSLGRFIRALVRDTVAEATDGKKRKGKKTTKKAPKKTTKKAPKKTAKKAPKKTVKKTSPKKGRQSASVLEDKAFKAVKNLCGSKKTPLVTDEEGHLVPGGPSCTQPEIRDAVAIDSEDKAAQQKLRRALGKLADEGKIAHFGATRARVYYLPDV